MAVVCGLAAGFVLSLVRRIGNKGGVKDMECSVSWLNLAQLQPTTYCWDTCGPHAILRALGGDIISAASGLPITYATSKAGVLVHSVRLQKQETV